MPEDCNDIINVPKGEDEILASLNTGSINNKSSTYCW